jgi:hypothetical protein
MTEDKTMTEITPFITEIIARGGETDITGQYGSVELEACSERDGLVLLRCEGWRQYSRAFGARRASLAYLCGVDDNGPWAVRVPGTCSTVTEATEWVTPAKVRDAIYAGRRVKRQGDIYAVECGDRKDRTHMAVFDLGTDVVDVISNDRKPRIGYHAWNTRTRYLTHHPTDGRKHRPLKVSFPARFYRQKALEMGRSGRYGSAD